jgi:alpha-L-fucosidase 2
MAAMDSELIGLLMRDCLEAVDLLRSAGRVDAVIPEGFVEEIQTAAKKLAPPRIGTDGTILEWGMEVEEGEPGHRHLSHVIGAYPYHAITARDSKLFTAIRKSIEKRIRNGGAYTGWSRVWAGGLMARLGDGNTARDLVGSMARYSGLPNLFSCCNIRQVPKLLEDAKPMQIDGNLGTVQAVIEMLLQSHDGEIVILPALPESWKKGNFRGLVARGNVVIDAWWDAGRLSRARVAPRLNGKGIIVTGRGFCLRVDGDTSLEDKEGRFEVDFFKDKIYWIERKGEEKEC